MNLVGKEQLEEMMIFFFHEDLVTLSQSEVYVLHLDRKSY